MNSVDRLVHLKLELLKLSFEINKSNDLVLGQKTYFVVHEASKMFDWIETNRKPTLD